MFRTAYNSIRKLIDMNTSEKTYKKYFSFILIFICMISFLRLPTVVYADYPIRHSILLPQKKGAYVGGSYNQIYNVEANRVPGNGAWFITSYSQQPEMLIENFDISSFNDIRFCALALAPFGKTVTTPSVKYAEVYSVLDEWDIGDSVLPKCSDSPIVNVKMDFNSLQSDEIPTVNGYRSLLNDGYPNHAECTDVHSEYGTNGLTNYTHLIDITHHVKKLKENNNNTLRIMMKPVNSTQMNMQTLRLYVEFTDNRSPKIETHLKAAYEEGKEIPIDFRVYDQDDSINNVSVYFDTEKIGEYDELAVKELNSEVVVPKSLVTGGRHTITITATDSWGLMFSKIEKINIRRTAALGEEGVITRTAPWMLNWHLTTEEQYSNEYKGGECGQMLWSLDISPFDENLLLAATDTSGIYRSTDGGRKWRASNSGLNVTGTVGIAFDPTDSRVVYCLGSPHISYTSGIAGGIYVSRDSGITWKLEYETPFFRHNGKYIAFDDRKVYVASHNEGVLLSDDFGKSWTSLGNPDVENNDYIRCIDVIDGIPVIVYNNAGVYRYYESNWEELNDGITLGNDMFYVAANPKNTKNLFVTCADCIYESTDGGMNWKPLKTSKEIGGKPVRLYFGESDCGELIMYLQLSLTSKNMRISTDFGKTFQKPEINHVNAFSRENTGYGAEAMAVSHINGMVSYVSFNGEIYKSSDGGKTYSSSSSGISGMRVCNYWFNPEIEDDIFMAVTDWGAVRTVPDVTESYLSVVDYSPMEDSTGIRKETQSGSKSCRAVCVDPKNTNKVFAVIGSWDSGTIKYSEDGGKNYISTDIFDCNAPVMNYVYDSQNNGVIYAGNYISYDGGISWVIQPCTVIGISETDSNIAYGAKKISETEIHLMRTDNYGKIWRECTDLNINGYQRCTVDLDNPGIAYIGGYSNGYSVYIWDENDDVTRYGRSTKNVFADIASKYNMSAIPIYMVAQDPADHDHLICGGVDNVYYKNMPGIFESFDRGESWNLVKGITGASDAWCIQFHPTIPSVFIATSAGTFVYEYDKSKNCDVVITHENDDVRVWNCQNVLINANVIGVTNDLVDEIAIVSFEPYENKVFDFESKKYFVWNNLDNLVPLCKALDLTEGR